MIEKVIEYAIRRSVSAKVIKRRKQSQWNIVVFKKELSFYVKSLVSIILLYYVFRKVGWQDLWKEIKHADLYYFTVYIVLGLFVTLVSAIKWLVLVRPHGISASLRKLFWLYMVGYFFNNILPTSVGGDVIRAYELGRFEGKTREAMASVFMERFTGVTTLILFALSAVLWDERYVRDIRVVLPLLVVLVGYVGIVVMVFNRSFVSFLEQRVTMNILGRLLRKLQGFQEAIYMYKIYIKLRSPVFDEHAVTQLASIHMYVNNSKEAYEALKFVILNNPDKRQEIFWIGEIYQELNK